MKLLQYTEQDEYDNPMTVIITEETAIKRAQRSAESHDKGFRYGSEAEALEDFKAVNWATRFPEAFIKHRQDVIDDLVERLSPIMDFRDRDSDVDPFRKEIIGEVSLRVNCIIDDINDDFAADGFEDMIKTRMSLDLANYLFNFVNNLDDNFRHNVRNS